MSKTEDIWIEPPIAWERLDEPSCFTIDPIAAKPVAAKKRTCKICQGEFTSPTATLFCGADCAKEGQPRGRKRQVNTQTYTVPGKTARPRTIEKVCEAPGCGRPFMAVREAARFCGNGCRGRNNRHQAIDRAVVACADGWRKAVEALEGQVALYKRLIGDK